MTWWTIWRFYPIKEGYFRIMEAGGWQMTRQWRQLVLQISGFCRSSIVDTFELHWQAHPRCRLHGSSWIRTFKSSLTVNWTVAWWCWTSSCFGSTNSGTRLFTKTQICLSCFGSTNLGRSASFQSSDGLFNLGCLLLFVSSPFILSFHCPCAPRLPCWGLSHCFGHDPSHSMHLAYEFGLTALASVSSSRPPQLGICCCR